MYQDHHARSRLPATARQHISGVAFSALIAAAFLLFFGFINPFLRVEGDPLFDASIVTFNSTMQYGGILMLISAVLCWMGMRYALLFDAMVSAIIGVLLIAVGIVWLTRGQMTGYLLPIFALMFLHAARSNWLLHAAIMRELAAPVGRDEAAPSHAQQVDAEAEATARERLFDHLKQVRAGETPSLPEAPPATVAEEAPPQPDRTPEPEPDLQPEPEPEKPGGGFLADLGRDDDKD